MAKYLFLVLALVGVLVFGGSQIGSAQNQVESSKLNSYGVQSRPDAESSKLNSYTVQSPPGGESSKLNSYSVQSVPNAGSSKLNSYAILHLPAKTSKLNSYVVLVGTGTPTAHPIFGAPF